MRISDWSSDVCSSDLDNVRLRRLLYDTVADSADGIEDVGVAGIGLDKGGNIRGGMEPFRRCPAVVGRNRRDRPRPARAEPFEEADGILGVRLRLSSVGHVVVSLRSEEATCELQPLIRLSYAVFGWK